MLRVALHFEDEDPAVIRGGVDYPFTAGMWGKNCTSAEFRIPWDDTVPTEAAITEAVRVMQILVQRTWPIVQAMRRERCRLQCSGVVQTSRQFPDVCCDFWYIKRQLWYHFGQFSYIKCHFWYISQSVINPTVLLLTT